MARYGRGWQEGESSRRELQYTMEEETQREGPSGHSRRGATEGCRAPEAAGKGLAHTCILIGRNPSSGPQKQLQLSPLTGGSTSCKGADGAQAPQLSLLWRPQAPRQEGGNGTRESVYAEKPTASKGVTRHQGGLTWTTAGGCRTGQVPCRGHKRPRVCRTHRRAEVAAARTALVLHHAAPMVFTQHQERRPVGWAHQLVLDHAVRAASQLQADTQAVSDRPALAPHVSISRLRHVWSTW